MHPFNALLLVAIVAPTLAMALDPPKETCSNIQWSPDFLKEYPKAPVACREITVKDGVKYAKFNGKVSKTGSQLVQVEISDVADIPISTIAFQVGVGGRITVEGKEERVKDLKVGDVLTFWVREGQFGISPTLAAQPMRVVKPDAMTN
jgi:hypothetical protein